MQVFIKKYKRFLLSEITYNDICNSCNRYFGKVYDFAFNFCSKTIYNRIQLGYYSIVSGVYQTMCCLWTTGSNIQICRGHCQSVDQYALCQYPTDRDLQPDRWAIRSGRRKGLLRTDRKRIWRRAAVKRKMQESPSCRRTNAYQKGILFFLFFFPTQPQRKPQR